MNRIGVVALACALTLAAAEHANRPGLRAVVDAVRSEVKPEEAMGFMRSVYASDRWFTFPKFAETAAYLKSAAERAGLQEAQIVNVPADGVTQFGYWTEPLAWDVKSAKLTIVDPDVAETDRVLADYEKVPASLGMWSGPTPPGGATAEIVELKTKKAAEIARMDLRGKLVMFDNTPGVKWALAKAGALGAINTFTENPSLADSRQWINAWGDNGWGFTKGSAPLLSFSITPRQTAMLRRLLARGTVKAHAVVDSRYYAGSYPYVTAAIPGTGQEREEVLVLGHSSEQGAQDNATGVAATLEAMATLHRLIASGRLPRPKRTIRMLSMGEMYGSMPYVARNAERIKRTVAAICLDTPAASYDLAGTEYTFYLSPHSSPTYTDAFVLRLAETYFPLVKRPWHSHSFMTGTDTYLSEPMVNVPTPWPYSGSGVQTHHNSADTPDRVDARSLRDISVVAAAYLYYIAAAEQPEAEWLGQVALTRAYQQVAAAAERSAEAVRYTANVQRGAVLSAARLAPAARENLERLAAGLDEFARTQEARARQAGRTQAGQPVPPESASMVVKRKRFGTITLDDLSVPERDGFPSGAWASEPILSLYWCDGKRTLADVIRLTRQEIGPTDFDFVAYYRFLARRGYVEIENVKR